jgi:hypothetical protein
MVKNLSEILNKQISSCVKNVINYNKHISSCVKNFNKILNKQISSCVNTTKRINNCNVKLNKPWFDGECRNARKKYKSSKRRSKRFKLTTIINETKHLEKE